MRRTLLILGIVAASWTTAAAAAAEPTLTIRAYCPVQQGQQLYGAQATASGLPPGAVFNLTVSFGGISGDVLAVQSDADGGLGPMPFTSPRRFRYISVALAPLSPEDSIAPMRAKVKRPCRRVGKRRRAPIRCPRARAWVTRPAGCAARPPRAWWRTC